MPGCIPLQSGQGTSDSGSYFVGGQARMEKSPYEDLPEKILAAFADRTMLSLGELARVLEMDRETLKKIRERGDITGRIKGVGRVKRHWVFTIADVAKYLRSTHANKDPNKSLDYLQAQLAHASLRPGTRIILLKPRRKSKAVSNLGDSDQGPNES
jgi:hypothetical protein